MRIRKNRSSAQTSRYSENLTSQYNHKDIQNQSKILLLKNKYLNLTQQQIPITPKYIQQHQFNNLNNYFFDNSQHKQITQNPFIQQTSNLKKRLDKSIQKYTQREIRANNNSKYIQSKFTFSHYKQEPKIMIDKTKNKQNKQNRLVSAFESKVKKQEIIKSYRKYQQYESWLHFYKKQIQIDKQLQKYINIFPLQLAEIIVQINNEQQINLVKAINSGIDLRDKQIKQKIDSIIKQIRNILIKCRDHWQKRREYKIELPRVGIKNTKNLMSLRQIESQFVKQWNMELSKVEIAILKYRIFKNAQVINIEQYNSNL